MGWVNIPGDEPIYRLRLTESRWTADPAPISTKLRAMTIYFQVELIFYFYLRLNFFVGWLVDVADSNKLTANLIETCTVCLWSAAKPRSHESIQTRLVVCKDSHFRLIYDGTD